MNRLTFRPGSDLPAFYHETRSGKSIAGRSMNCEFPGWCSWRMRELRWLGDSWNWGVVGQWRFFVGLGITEEMGWWWLVICESMGWRYESWRWHPGSDFKETRE